MRRNIIDCISTMEEFRIEDYIDLDIGVEIQDFVEPNLNEDEIELTIEAYKKLFKDFKNTKALHGPFLDLKPASPDKDIRRVSQNKYFDILNIAEELEMDYVIFHSQMNPLLNEPEIMELNYSQNGDFFNLLMKETSYRSIVLIENIFEKNPNDMIQLIDKIKSDKVKLILDIGHAKLSGNSIESWIKELNTHIAYIHFHTNNGIYDEHKSPTDEEIEELYSLIDKYHIDPVVSLEYKKKDLKEEIKRFKE